MLEMALTVLREPLALSGLLPSVLQLVNRLGSARGGAELCMQSPAVRAREQLHREQLAAVEGKWYCGARLGGNHQPFQSGCASWTRGSEGQGGV